MKSNLTPQEKQSLIDMLRTLTDEMLSVLWKTITSNSGGIADMDPDLLRAFYDEFSNRPGLLESMVNESKGRKNMRITETNLRRIIRKTIVEHRPFHGGHSTVARGADMPLPTPRSNVKGYGWHDFKMMASAGDYEGCSDWLEDYCLDRGIRLYSEMVQHMCEYASDETVTEAELEKEMQALSKMY